MESGPSFAALPEYPPPAEQPVVRYAGWGYRVAAFLTDAGIALAVATLAGLALGGDDVGTRETVVGLGVVAVWILVTSVAMGVFEGQTVGKRLTGTRVVLGDRPVGFGLSLLRGHHARLRGLPGWPGSGGAGRGRGEPARRSGGRGGGRRAARGVGAVRARLTFRPACGVQTRRSGHCRTRRRGQAWTS